MAERDDVLRKSYTDLVFFGKAFLPKDFLNKSKSPDFHYSVGRKLINTKQETGLASYFLGALVSQFFQKQRLCINYAFQLKMSNISLLGYQKNKLRLLTTSSIFANILKTIR